MLDACGLACGAERSVHIYVYRLVPELGPLASYRALEFKKTRSSLLTSILFGEMKWSIWDGALAVWATAFLLFALGAHAHASSEVRGLRRILQVKGVPIKPPPQEGLAVQVPSYIHAWGHQSHTFMTCCLSSRQPATPLPMPRHC